MKKISIFNPQKNLCKQKKKHIFAIREECFFLYIVCTANT